MIEDTDQRPDGLPRRQRFVVLAVMMSGTTAACISQSMMISALPTIMHEYGVNASLGQLLTTSYIFTLGLISAMTAFLVHRVNSKTLFIASMLCFVTGCAAALFAPNYPLLLASRLLQAGGAGIALPLIQVVALSVYPKSEYGRAMGLVGLIIGFAPAIGPTVSGFLIDFWGWRSVFVVLGIITMVVIALALPLLTDVVKRPDEPERFDVPSGLLYTLGFCAVMAGVTLAEAGEGFALAAAAAFVAGATALAVFARRQLRIENPLLKLACFRSRTFTVSTVLVLAAQVAFMAGSIMVPLFVQDVQGDSAAVSGLTILPGAVLLGMLNPVTGRMLDRRGPRPLIVVGCAVLVAGTLAFCLLDANTPEWVVTVLYGVRTVGVACLMMPLTAHACAALPTADIAQGTAIITSFRQIFGSIASSALIAVMASASGNPLGIDAFGFGVSFAVQAALIVVGFVVGMALLPRTAKG
ncbi:DHA2 family efflux MFS transporter permease subunit [Gordonibacter sp. An230]|uniref:DHA2 family efflux MFS transporter permease subunit n=1 Tax=Gordonibacter sp. An230 TaxID=1965592 RepID=UPI001EF4EDC5|nr:DHA2 family efflux MFS transporter permease subunit [Gordonibacter sp. An230]